MNHSSPLSSSVSSSPVKYNSLDVQNLSWLAPLGVTFDEKMIPHFNLSSHEIKQNLRKYLSETNSNDIKSRLDMLHQFMIQSNILKNWLLQLNRYNSFVKLLCEIPELQDNIFKNLTEYFSMTEFESNQLLVRQIAMLVIKELSFIKPFIKSSEILQKLIFDSIRTSAEIIKPIFVQSVFQIIDPTEEVTNELLGMMEETPELTKDILLSFQYAELSDKDLDIVRKRILENVLPSAGQDELPTVIQFLVSTTTEKNATSTVDAFRDGIVIGNLQNEGESKSGDFTKSDGDDYETFVVEQLRQSFACFTCFATAFAKALDCVLGWTTLDVWALLALFSVPAHRNRVMSIASKASGKGLTPSSVEKAIIGHGRALESVCSSMTDLGQWMACQPSKNIHTIGCSLLRSVFIELTRPGPLQDAVASLAATVGFSEGVCRSAAVFSIADLSRNYSQKLAPFAPLIESLLWTADGLSTELFASVAEIVSRLLFLNSESTINGRGNQLLNGLRKLLGSTRKGSRKKAAIAYASVILRLDSIEDDQKDDDKSRCSEELFDECLENACDDVLVQTVLFDELSRNNISERLKTHIRDILENEIEKLFVPYAKGDVMNIIYENDGEEESIDFSSNPPDTQRRRSLLASRGAVAKQTRSYVFSGAGLRLFAKCGGLSSRIACSHLRVDTDSVESLILVHNWIIEIINGSSPEYGIQRPQHLIIIEDELLRNLSTKSYTDPYFENVNFNKPKTVEEIFVKLRNLDRSSLLLCNSLSKPLLKNERNIAIRLIQAGNILINEELPDSFIEFIAKSSLDKENDKLPEISSSLLSKIIGFRIRSELGFASVVSSLNLGENIKEVFDKFYECATSNDDSSLRLLSILKLLLRGMKEGNEDERSKLYSISERLLKSSETSPSSTKMIVPIFFETSPSPLRDAATFATSVFGNDRGEWRSLSKESFPFFLRGAMSVITAKLAELRKRADSPRFEISEEAASALLNRVNKLVAVERALLRHAGALPSPLAAGQSTPKSAQRAALECSTRFVDGLRSLLPFAREASKFDPAGVRKLESGAADVAALVQSLADGSRRADRATQALIPNARRALASWNIEASDLSKN